MSDVEKIEEKFSESLAVNREILNICRQAYESEVEFRIGIEKKAQLFISLLTLLAGSFILSSGFKELLGSFGGSGGSISVAAIVIPGFGLLLAIATGILNLLGAILPAHWRSPFPPQLHTKLFSPESGLAKDEISLLRYCAKNYLYAAEFFRDDSMRKSNHLRWGARALGISFAFFFILTAILIFS